MELLGYSLKPVANIGTGSKEIKFTLNHFFVIILNKYGWSQNNIGTYRESITQLVYQLEKSYLE